MLSNKCLCMMLVSELHGIISSSLTQQTHKNTLSTSTVLAWSPLLFENDPFLQEISIVPLFGRSSQIGFAEPGN